MSAQRLLVPSQGYTKVAETRFDTPIRLDFHIRLDTRAIVEFPSCVNLHYLIETALTPLVIPSHLPRARSKSNRKQVVVIDCKGHLLGRLAATIAKELLKGQKIVCVRTEELNMSGSLGRNHLLWEHYVNKRMNTNPNRGPFHFRAPSAMLYRAVRGMVPYTTARGARAMSRLLCFEGCPAPYDKVKRVVVPHALTIFRLKPGRTYCRIGDLATRVGWTHGAVVKRLEEKRALKASAYHKKKVAAQGKIAKALQDPKVVSISQQLAQYGY